jgi:DNA-binding Lrp family transcriptional regulator
MDDLDQQLITSLRHNARRSVSDLALDLGVSRATIRARLDKLERDRVIMGYTVVVKEEADIAPVRGIMSLEVEGRSTDAVVKALSGFPEVVAVHSTNGRWDLILEVRAATLADLDSVLRRIRLVPAIRTSETNLLLSTLRGRPSKSGSGP